MRALFLKRTWPVALVLLSFLAAAQKVRVTYGVAADLPEGAITYRSDADEQGTCFLRTQGRRFKGNAWLYRIGYEATVRFIQPLRIPARSSFHSLHSKNGKLLLFTYRGDKKAGKWFLLLQEFN